MTSSPSTPSRDDAHAGARAHDVVTPHRGSRAYESSDSEAESLDDETLRQFTDVSMFHQNTGTTDDPDGSSDSVVDSLSAIDRENALFDVVVRMRTGLSDGKHRRRFTKHKNCFTGRQAVQWMVSSRTVRDAEEAVKLGNDLMAAKLIVGVTKSGRAKFEKRSHLYAYHLGVAPGISAAKYYVSTEMMSVEAKLKMVKRVVDGHTSIVEALSREHAGTMENVERLIATLKLELSVLRAAVIALVVYSLMPLFHRDAAAIASVAGVGMEYLSTLIVVIAGVAVVASSLLSISHFDLSIRTMFEAKEGAKELGDDFDEKPQARKRISLKELPDNYTAQRTPSTFLQASAQTLQRTASRLMHLQSKKKLRPEERAGPPPSIPPELWVDAPCALRFSPEDAHKIVQEDQLPDNMVRAQVPFEIDSEIFKGRMIVFIKGLDNTPKHIFAGKARTIQLAIQGKFKREVAMDECVIGQALTKPLINLPSRWLLALCVRVVRGYGENWGIDLSMPTDDNPYMLAPMALAAQAMSCEYEGDVQDIEGAIIENVDTRADIFAPGTTPRQRQKTLKGLLRKARKGEGEMPKFDTERVWTFGFWQSQINFLTYRIDLGVGVFNLLKVMNGQPLCFCSSLRSGEILFRLEVWHRELLEAARDAHEKERNRHSRTSLEKSLDSFAFSQGAEREAGA